MCSNYRPVTSSQRLLTFFGVKAGPERRAGDVFPTGSAPFIRLTREATEGGEPALLVEDGLFGLLPHFATEVAYGRRTYNARSETVAKLASFRQAWAHGQRCIIPAEHIYEPNWETGKAVRWKIFQAGDVPFGIAGIYRRWKNPAGGELNTFAMLTVNADGHPVMSRFHAPGKEKRMVIILDKSEYMDWLTCPVEQAPHYFRQWNGELLAEPAPLDRVKKASPEPPHSKSELF